eukprot:15365651-Ditylum_brightwellii.AAC.1
MARIRNKHDHKVMKGENNVPQMNTQDFCYELNHWYCFYAYPNFNKKSNNTVIQSYVDRVWSSNSMLRLNHL